MADLDFLIGLRLACALSFAGAFSACGASRAGLQDGAAGSSGAAGSAGAGGLACTSPREANPQLPGPRDPAVLAVAAAVVGSCRGIDGINFNLAALWASNVNHSTLAERTVLQARCLASARCGCGALHDCLGYDVVYRTVGESFSCAGPELTVCVQPPDTTGACLHADCSAFGLSCDARAGCIEPPTTVCDSTTFAPSCDAKGRPQNCDSGYGAETVFTGPDCAAHGLTCVAGQCVGGGAACSAEPADPRGELHPEGRGCVGPRLDACVGGKHATLDCAARGPGFSCQTFAGRSFCGLASECLPGDAIFKTETAKETCDLDTVVFCDAGRVERVDCRKLGFSGCKIDAAKDQYGCIPRLAN